MALFTHEVHVIGWFFYSFYFRLDKRCGPAEPNKLKFYGNDRQRSHVCALTEFKPELWLAFIFVKIRGVVALLVPQLAYPL